MRLSIISPTYNEVDNIEPLTKEIVAVLGDLDYEILFVDDDSPDLTWKRAVEVGKRFPQVGSLRRTGNRDLSSAVIEGFTKARGEIVACIDADLQHDPRILPPMLQAIDEGADLAVGSRYVQGGGTGERSWLRSLSSWEATKLARILLHVDLKDPMSGFFLLRRSDFMRVRDGLNVSGFKILLEIVARQKPKRVVEVPYTFRNRQLGKSKLSGLVVLKYVRQLSNLSRRAA